MERGKSSTGNPLYYETNFYRPEPEVEDRKQLSVYSAERTPGESESSLLQCFPNSVQNICC